MAHRPNGILFSHKHNENNEIMPFAATWMQLEILILSEMRKRKTKIIWYHLYVESKIWHKWTYPQNRNRDSDIENILVVARGAAGGMEREFGVSRYKLSYVEWIKNKDLLYSIGNYSPYPVINYNEKEYCFKKWLYMCNWITWLYSRN